jgi:hypothetical protein
LLESVADHDEEDEDAVGNADSAGGTPQYASAGDRKLPIVAEEAEASSSDDAGVHEELPGTPPPTDADFARLGQVRVDSAYAAYSAGDDGIPPIADAPGLPD